MTETFTAEQLIDAANVIIERIPVACDCFPCVQERQTAEMLAYAVDLIRERDALMDAVAILRAAVDA